jgi:hypothetical protein
MFPTANRTGLIRILNNSAPDVGVITITTGGVITIQATVAGTNFANTGTAAFFDFSFDYNI